MKNQLFFCQSISSEFSRICSWIKTLRLGLLWAPVALHPVYGWLYAQQVVERFFEEKQEVILSFCFLLLLMSQTQVDTFCCFITSCVWVCVCAFVWLQCNDDKDLWQFICLPWFRHFAVRSLPTFPPVQNLEMCLYVLFCVVVCLLLDLLCQGAQIAEFIYSWIGMSSSLFWS